MTKVISEVRKEEQQRLRDSGDYKAAESLKESKYILASKRNTQEER